MNQKTAKKLGGQAEQLALQTFLAAEQKGMVLRHGKRTAQTLYQDLKKGKLP